MNKAKRKTNRLIAFVLSLAVLGLSIYALVISLPVSTGKPQGGGNPANPKEPDVPAMGQADLATQRTQLLEKADLLYRGYFYDEALELINSADKALQNQETADALAKIQQGKDSLVKYEGMPYHVFFHSLIIYPELAFDNKGHPAEGYNMWMTTVSEFKAMLPLLLENDFVLYKITDMSQVNPDGTVTQKDIYLPPGKKPLVISVDDVNYYDYMAPDGFASRLVLTEENEVLTEVKAMDGTVSVTRDGDVQPILDDFVAEHPEFSWRGAKGVLASTGYQGAFGYRITDLELYSAAEGQQMLEDVKKISQRLWDTGWVIANHSYTHNSYWRGNITMEQLQSDVTRWKELIGTYTGQTNVLIVPFGAHFDSKDPRFQYMVDQGFNIICPVAANMSTSYTGNGMIQNRLNLDGYTMLKHPERISKYFFDPAKVVDPARPPLA